MDRTFFIVLTIVLVLLNALFVAAEFALVKVRKKRLVQMAEDGVAFSKQALWLANRLDNSLSACQIGITMASLALGWVGEPAIASFLEPLFDAAGITSPAVVHTVSFIVAFSIITALHLLIGEQVRILAIRRPEQLSLWCALPLRFFYVVFYPFMIVLSVSTTVLLRRLGVTGGVEHDQVHSADELRSLVSDAHVYGALSRAKHSLIDAAFEFDQTIARQIMLPRVDVVFFDVEKPLSDAFALAKSTLHTRYPVCEGSLDHVIGVVHIKDLFGVAANDETVDLRSIMRPPRFVPETALISKLLGHFQATKQHLAFVVDEYGTLAGLVMLENVLERIVGPVQDEFDLETPDIVPDGPGRSLVQGGLSLDLVAHEFKLNWSSHEVSTVSGFITEQLGRVPVAGDRVELDGATVEVVAVDNSRATSLRIILPAKSETEDDT